MKKYTKIFAPLMLAFLVGSLTFVFAQSQSDGGNNGFKKDRPPRGEDFGPPRGGKHGVGLPPHVIEQLNLSDAQKEQIEAIKLGSKDAGKEYFDSVRNADEQLRTMVEGGNFNETEARRILNTKAQAMTEMEIIRLRTDAAIFNVLTAEQKTQLEQLKQQRPPRGGFRPEN